MLVALIIVFVACFHSANSFAISGKFQIRAARLVPWKILPITTVKLASISNEPPSTWEIDEDTAEILCESSADLARKAAAAAEKARIEAELALKKKLEEEEAERVRLATLQREEELRSLRVAESKTSELVAVSDSSSPSPLPPAVPPKKGAFDVGLIILFPIMIGTLLLFLFFPLIGQQVASSLPPPPGY
jgi:hypothetical protein